MGCELLLDDRTVVKREKYGVRITRWLVRIWELGRWKVAHIFPRNIVLFAGMSHEQIVSEKKCI